MKKLCGTGRVLFSAVVMFTFMSLPARALEPITPVAEPGTYAFSLELSRDERAMETELRQGAGLFQGQPDFTSTQIYLRGDYAVMPWTTVFLRLGTAKIDGGNFTVADLNGDYGLAWGGGLSFDFKNEFIVPGVRWGGSLYYNSYENDLPAGDMEVSEYGGTLRAWKAISSVIIYTGPRVSNRDVDIRTIAGGVSSTGNAEADEKFSWAAGLRYDLNEDITMNLESELIGQQSLGLSMVYRFGSPVGPMAPKRRERASVRPPWLPDEKEEAGMREEKKKEEAEKPVQPEPPGLFKAPALPEFAAEAQMKAEEKPAVRMTRSPDEIDVVTAKIEANEAFGNGRYDRAAALYEDVLLVEPNNFQAAHNRALSLYRLRQWAASEKAFAQAVDISPESAEARFHLGLTRFRQGNRAGAAEAWKQTLELDPGHRQARSNLAAIGQLPGQR